jgi:hypothetical protein
MEQLVKEINRLELSMIIKHQGVTQLKPPGVLSETIAKIAIYLSQLSDEVTNAELNFKQERARRFHENRKKESSSAAERMVRFDEELIKLESEADRLRNFIKRTENVITTIQTHIRVKNSEAAGNL